MIQGSITEQDIFNEIVTKSKQMKIDFILATPPCQGMSKAGKMQFDDPRNRLFLYVIDMIKKIKPKYVLIENVPEFINVFYVDKDGNQNKIMDKIKLELQSHYQINARVLNTKHFSVPQSRNRAIVLMSRNDQTVWSFPEPHTRLITVRDTISHLCSLGNNQKLIDKDIEHMDVKGKEKENILRWHFSKKTQRKTYFVDDTYTYRKIRI